METDDTIDLIGYFSRLRRFWLPALVTGLVVAVLASFWSLRTSAAPDYHTKSHVLVGPAAVTDNVAGADQQSIMASQVMRTFVALQDVPVLVDAASKALNGRFTPDQVANMTSINWGGGSLLLAVTADAPNEQDALDLSNAMSDALVKHGAEVLKLSPRLTPTLVKVEDAHIDPTLATPTASRAKGIGTGVAAGLVVGILVAIVLEAVSHRRRRRTAIES